MGLNIFQTDADICVDQLEFIESTEPISLSRDRCLQKKESCDCVEASLFRKLIGKLNWISTQTRPDIAFEVSSLSSVMRQPRVEDCLAANKVLRRIKEHPLKIRFPNLGNIDDIILDCYADASLGNLPSGQSSGGYILFLVNPSNMNCSPVIWKSNTLKRVVRSTLAAETSAMVEGLDAAFYVSKMLSEILYFGKAVKNIPIHAYTDNQSLHKNSASTTMPREHRLRVDLGVIKEMISKEEIEKFLLVDSANQLADCLTKHGASSLKLTRVLENGCLI